MNNTEVGRAVLAALSNPPSATADDTVALAREVLRLVERPCPYDAMLNQIGIPAGTPIERLDAFRASVREATVNENPFHRMAPYSKEQLAELLHRALRTWEDAPAKWVALHDRLTGVPAPAVRPEGEGDAHDVRV